MVGVANTLIDFGIYFVLTRFTFLSEYIYVANTIAFSIAVIFSYFVNRNWTFTLDSKPHIKEAAKFFGTNVSGFLINLTVMYIGVTTFGLFDLFVKLIATFVAVMWNFFITKFWVFKTKKV